MVKLMSFNTKLIPTYWLISSIYLKCTEFKHSKLVKSMSVLADMPQS